MKCRICDHNIEIEEAICDVDFDVTSVYSKFVKTPTIDTKFYYCKQCEHGQIQNILEENHYETYNLLNVDNEKKADGGGNFKRKERYYQKVLERLQGLVPDNKKILDIGCGIGDILACAEGFFKECIGVEPSTIECEIAKRNGHQVIHENFGCGFQGEDFSCFLSTQVFEHLENPLEAIQKAYDILKIGGVGYIDVPNGAMHYIQARYYDVYAEHLNYFSLYSLVMLAKSAGFEIISVEEIFYGNQLGIYVRKKESRVNFETKKQSDKIALKNLFTTDNTISVWGAGIKGRVFMRLLEEDMQKKISHIFDYNEALTGCYAGNSIVPIEKPSRDFVNENDIIIVTAIEYETEIIKELRENFDYKGKIWCINEAGPR